ncbi:hypothetical protein HN873_017061 [Arachis hypogaea]
MIEDTHKRPSKGVSCLATCFRFYCAAQPTSPPSRNPLPRRRTTRFPSFLSASYLGLKEFLPPYLDPNLTNKELITGVNFVSDGFGYDTLTPTPQSPFSHPLPLLYLLFANPRRHITLQTTPQPASTAAAQDAASTLGDSKFSDGFKIKECRTVY